MTGAGDLVDRENLRAFLAAELDEADDFGVERHEQGFSNETLFVTWGDRDLVIRRPPPGETADPAHDVLREVEVVDALRGSDVPVPTTIAESEDTGIMRCPFYARYLMGTSNNTFYQMMADGVPEMADHALDIIEGERPL